MERTLTRTTKAAAGGVLAYPHKRSRWHMDRIPVPLLALAPKCGDLGGKRATSGHVARAYGRTIDRKKCG